MNLKSLLTQIGNSNADLAKMLNKSELTIEEHCDSLRQHVDIARETALENIHKASNTETTEIDTYERECLSSWTAAKESTEQVVEDVSKRMREFLAEQHAFLQSFQASDTAELTIHLDEANKLTQELSDHKKQRKAAMFGNKIASFVAFLSISDSSLLGELAFAHIQLPFNKLDISTNALKAVDICADFDFLLPLEHGQRIVAFQSNADIEDDESYITKVACFDRLISISRQIHLVSDHVIRSDVAQCGPNEFVVSCFTDEPEMRVYDSDLRCLRKVQCKYFSRICCNSKFVFGLFDTDDDGQEEAFSNQRVQVHHLDTLSEAFELRVLDEYRIVQLKADERHVVAMSRLSSEPSSPGSCQWFMSIFDLQASDEKKGNNKMVRFFRAERHIDLAMQRLWLSEVFLLDGWLVVPHKDENTFVWFDAKGERSETSTDVDLSKLRAIYSSDGSSLLFALDDDTLLLKRFYRSTVSSQNICFPIKNE